MADLTFSLGGDGQVTVRSWKELHRWIETEHSKWAWLAPGDPRTSSHGIANNVQGAWTSVINQVQNAEDSDELLEEATEYLRPISNGQILVSTTRNGATVLDILQSSGDTVATFAAGFILRIVSLPNATTPDELLGAMLSVAPNLSRSVELDDHLKRERVNFKNATRSLIERLDREAEERQRSNADLVKRASGVARRIFDRKRTGWRDVQNRWDATMEEHLLAAEQRSADAVASMTTTEQTYREFMKLKAPVEYWNSKATEHAGRERSARRLLYWYFPITSILLVSAFVCAGAFLLLHPDTQTSKAPLALYVVVSGGLLLITTIGFWIGRLLTKLYLSEHHLRNDAEERATMTTTYLALTSEAAAADMDRQIILNALFRASPDGIVREDGPTDASVQGFIAKLLSR